MYPRISITTDAVIFSLLAGRLAVLLIQRANEPYKNSWALPGGFLEAEESLEEGCRRELKEETGLEIGSLKQVGIYDQTDRDPRGRTITVAFTTKIDKPKIVVGADDAKEARWILIDELDNLAFDHLKIIEHALKVLSLK